MSKGSPSRFIRFMAPATPRSTSLAKRPTARRGSRSSPNAKAVPWLGLREAGAPQSASLRGVFSDLAVLHHEHHALGGGDVGRGIPRHGHDVGYLALFERASVRRDP